MADYRSNHWTQPAADQWQGQAAANYPASSTAPASNPYSYEAFQANQQKKQPYQASTYPQNSYTNSGNYAYPDTQNQYAQGYSNDAGATSYSTAPQQTQAQQTNGYGNSNWDSVIANDPQEKETRRISAKWQKRLYWIVPLVILAIVCVILFQVYKDDFKRWVKPLANWLKKHDSWSWAIPVAILIVLSFPPLFGHEIVMLIVGLTYPLGIGIGIACAGTIIGEAACFVVFKFCFSGYAHRKVRESVKWAAVARVSQEAGFKGVLLIRYSIIPPHLANPIFATTGMSFFVYMATVILSLPKTIVLVALGDPNNEGKHGVTAAKVIAFGILGLITLYGTLWIRKRIKIATAEIEAERATELKSELGDPSAPNGSVASPEAAYPASNVSPYHGNNAASNYPPNHYTQA